MSTTKLFALSVTLVVSAAFTVETFAETLLMQPRDIAPTYRFIMSEANGTSTYNYWDGIQTKDLDTDTAYRLFCTDLYTYTSNAFSYTGQGYTSTALANSEFHTDLQISQLQSLFDHVYTKAFNADYSYNNDFYASLFQFAIWEIVNDTADELSLREGDLHFLDAGYLASNGVSYYQSNEVMEEALTTLDSWFYAIVNNAWDEIGYDEDKVNLTVYLAEGGTHVSQTFIGVDPYATHYQAATPEPTTMLIVGLGIVGIGTIAARRKTQKKA